MSQIQIADSLARITAGWKSSAAQKPASLDEARLALAASLTAGFAPEDLHAGLTTPAAAPSDPQVTDALERLTPASPNAESSSGPALLGFVRSAANLDPNNPSGLPPWARGMQVQLTHGPFTDPSGIPHFVDVIPLLQQQASVAFGTASGVIGSFPIEKLLPGGTTVILGGGSVWFASNLLVKTLPSGSFSGFRISGGKLTASASFQLQGGVYLLPANATMTLIATLDPPSTPAAGNGIGQDAEADSINLPATVTISFSQSAATIEALDPSGGTVYGTSFSFTRNTSPPIAFNNNTAVLIPCTSSISTFAFAAVASTEFVPSGTAPLVGTGWVLPIAVTTISALGQAAGAGSLLLGMGAGARAHWRLHPSAASIAGWQIFLDPARIIVIAGGTGSAVARTTLQLWPERQPSKRRSTVDFLTPAAFLITFISSPGSETLIALGTAVAHLDRPLAADGHRYELAAPALVGITTTGTGTELTMLARQTRLSQILQPLALENALLGVHLPFGFLLNGLLQADSFTQCGIGLFFAVKWMLPTLPDPYAATFDLKSIVGQLPAGLTAVALWGPPNDVVLQFALGAAPSIPGLAHDPAGAKALASRAAGHFGFSALLDLSTKVDLFGVAVLPGRGGIAGADIFLGGPVGTGAIPETGPVGTVAIPVAASQTISPLIGTLLESHPAGLQIPNPASGQTPIPSVLPPVSTAPAPPFGFAGLSLAVNGATCATFALPQVSWEPMESVNPPPPDVGGALFCNPPSDGPPLLLTSPDQQQLVPLSPAVVLVNNINNVIAGHPLQAQFSLPFGLVAHVRQPNRPPNKYLKKALFLQEGGEFHANTPSFPPSSAPGAPAISGAMQVTLKPVFPQNSDAIFAGYTTIDRSGSSGPSTGYGYNVLSASAGTIFDNEFNLGNFKAGVPLRRIDLAGYGASIFSEWADTGKTAGSHVTKVDFETVVGRTAFELVQVATQLYPYYVDVVRTITIQRQNSGWVQRSDTGWKAASEGLFQFPAALGFANRVHRGAVAGVFNVRNIREVENFIHVPKGSASPPNFEFKQVLFDADIGLDQRVTVLQGGSPTTLKDLDGNAVTLCPAHDLVGYVQLGPDGVGPTPADLQGLFQQTGPITAAFSCMAQIGALGAASGTALRCSAIEVDMALKSSGASLVPALGAALRSAPVLPHDGAWGFGQRRSADPAPAPLAHDFPVPIVQPTTDANTWHIANIADVLQLDKPDTMFGILQDTGTQKLLFEQPTVPILGAASPPGSQPGISLPNPPNFADVASLLGGTGLFPDIANTIALLGGPPDHLQNVGDSLKYTKTVTFDPRKPAQVLLDLGVIKVALSYADESQGRDGSGNANKPTTLTYTLDPGAGKRWSFEIDNLSFLVIVPAFDTNPLLTIIGGLVADDRTKPTLSNLNVVYGAALDTLKSIFSKLQKLAQFLPGGAGAGLNIALSDGKLTVTDVFNLPTLPLGLGELTDIGIDLGLTLTLSPLSADFMVGVGGPDNPFNWIVSPLAGNGLIDIGVKNGKPELTVQGGIGLGLAIDLGIASGSASITIAVRLDVTGSTITVIFILNGQASVDVLGGLASASITLTASVGVSVNPLPLPKPIFLPAPGFDFPAEDITFLASVSVGIHISICWVVNVSFDGSWQFSQAIHTPEIRIVA